MKKLGDRKVTQGEGGRCLIVVTNTRAVVNPANIRKGSESTPEITL